MYTFSGRYITPEAGVPSVSDIAVQLGRICRFCGAVARFYPVLIHSLVVADLLPKNLELYGLLHDASELFYNDIPGPAKPSEIRNQEVVIFGRICGEVGIPKPTELQLATVKHADVRALQGESYTVGPPGVRNHYKRDIQAERLVNHYLETYSVRDCVYPDGKAVRDFIRRVVSAGVDGAK